MNLGKYHKKNGFTTIFVLAGMLLVATVLPIATKLVEQNQENRSEAASKCSCSKSGYGSAYTCSTNGGTWKCTTIPTSIPTKKLNPTPTKKSTSGPTPVCNSSHCGNCVNSSACQNAACKWAGGACMPYTISTPTKKPTPTPTKKPATATCSNGYMKCSGSNVQTCKSGSWTTTATCNANQTCEESTDTYAVCKSKPTSTCSNGSFKCESGNRYKCVAGDWEYHSSCPYGCSDTACKPAPPTSTPTKKPDCSPNGSMKCIGSGQLQQCVLGNWANASKCASGVCNSAGTGCGGSVPTPTPVCNSSHCGNCVNSSACQNAACKWAGGACMPYTINSTPTPAIKLCSSDTSYTRECVHSSFSSCESVVEGTTVCSGTSTPKCCVNSKPAAGTKTYYYYAATKGCLPTSLYTSVIDCNSAKGVCFSSADKCTSAYSCESLGGTCRSVCGADESLNSNGYYECQPAKCCVPNTTESIDGVCNSEVNGKTLTSRPSDIKACTKGSVYWTNPSGLNFQYSWECRGINNGKAVNCSAQKTCSVGTKRCFDNIVQTCVNNNGEIIWKNGLTCSAGCDSNTFECKAKCKFNGVLVTTDQMTPNNVCTLGVSGNTLIKNGKVWTWTCGGELYAEVSCSATDQYGNFGNDCQEDKDCGDDNKCVDNKCIKSGYCVSTKINNSTQIWKGDICSNNKKYTCTNNGQNFWSFKETPCKFKCQNNNCLDGYICTNEWSEHYNPDNKLLDSTQCGSGCDSTTGRCKGQIGSIFKCVKGGLFGGEDWSEEYDSQNKKINSTHCYEGGCNQITGKCATAKDASIQYPVCESKGGVCFGNVATCRNEGGSIISGADCASPMVCCGFVDKTDGVCNTPKITNNEIPSTDKLCLNGTFSFVSYENQKYSWQCQGSSNGGKTVNCSVTVTNPKTSCDQQPIGAQKCQTPYISLKCTTNGWEPVYCDDYSGQYCLTNKCEKPSTPQKEGDSCLDNVSEFSCPGNKNLTCLNHKCVTFAKAEEIQKNKTQCIATSYNLGTVYDSQTACPSGLSCNRRTGTCEIPEKITAKKAAGDFCNTDAECLTGYCMPVTADATAPQICNDVTDREYIDKGNTSAAIIGGAVLAPVAILAGAEVLTSTGIVSAVSSLYGATSIAATTAITNFINNHPNLVINIQKFGNIADAIEIIGGAIACAQDPYSPLCQNLREDMAMPGMAGLADSVVDIIDDVGDLTRIVKTTESVAEITSDLTQLPKKDSTLGDLTDQLARDANLNMLEQAAKYSVDLSNPPRLPGSTKINEEVLEKYLASIGRPEKKAAMKLLAEKVIQEHISHDEFIDALTNKTVPSVNQIIGRSQYLAIVENYKSNKWVLQLSLPNLIQMPSDVISQSLNRSQTKDAIEYLTNNPSVRRVIMFDDASYSGQQLTAYSSRLQDEATAYGISDLEIVIAAPYMTTYAQSRLLGIPRVTLADHNIIPTADQIFTPKELLLLSDELGITGVTTRTVTTFDHKIADWLSTLNLETYLVSGGGFIPDPIIPYKR